MIDARCRGVGSSLRHKTSVSPANDDNFSSTASACVNECQLVRTARTISVSVTNEEEGFQHCWRARYVYVCRMYVHTQTKECVSRKRRITCLPLPVCVYVKYVGMCSTKQQKCMIVKCVFARTHLSCIKTKRQIQVHDQGKKRLRLTTVANSRFLGVVVYSTYLNEDLGQQSEGLDWPHGIVGAHKRADEPKRVLPHFHQHAAYVCVWMFCAS
jgi:hypothetical protein